MPERESYIPGVPCWVDTTQPDPDAAAMDAGRMAVLSDPEGATFCIWHAERHIGARVVNRDLAAGASGR